MIHLLAATLSKDVSCDHSNLGTMLHHRSGGRFSAINGRCSCQYILRAESLNKITAVIKKRHISQTCSYVILVGFRQGLGYRTGERKKKRNRKWEEGRDRGTCPKEL